MPDNGSDNERRGRFPGVTREADGTFTIRPRRPDGTQTTRRKLKTAAAARKLKAQIENGEQEDNAPAPRPQPRRQDATSVAAFIPTFRAGHRGPIAATWEGDYEGALLRIAASPIAPVAISRADSGDVKRMMRWLREQAPQRAGRVGYAPATCNNTLVVLGLLFKQAMELGLRTDNPVGKAMRERVHKRKIDYLYPEEVPGFLACCERDYRVIAEILVTCGPRISEPGALRVRDIDFARHTIRFKAQEASEGERHTKGDDDVYPPLTPHLERTLRDHIAREGERRPMGFDQHLLLRGPLRRRPRRLWDTPYKRDCIYDMHAEACERFGRYFTPHVLRHSAVYAWLSEGASMVQVRDWLGHKSVSTTESNYGRMRLPDGNIGQRLGERVWGPLEHQLAAG